MKFKSWIRFCYITLTCLDPKAWEHEYYQNAQNSQHANSRTIHIHNSMSRRQPFKSVSELTLQLVEQSAQMSPLPPAKTWKAKFAKFRFVNSRGVVNNFKVTSEPSHPTPKLKTTKTQKRKINHRNNFCLPI